MKRVHRRALFSIVAVLLGLCVIELSTFVFFNALRERFTFCEVNQVLLPEGVIEELKRHYDVRYGWDCHFDTPLGERLRPVSYGRPLISTFGDSFTYCSDVEDHETWQTYLAALLGADVYNFGTGGFGPDQAYMKYLDARESLETPIVILGMISENINRIVNVYRPFYFPKTGIRLPKPRFKIVGGKLERFENPLRSSDDIPRLAEEGFVMHMGRHDYWYNRDNCPVRRFPYTRILFNKRMWLEAYHGKTDNPINDVDPRPWESLWDERHASDLMLAIVGGFIDNARESGQIPVVLVLPGEEEMFEKVYTGNDPPGVTVIGPYCERRGCHFFNGAGGLCGKVATPEELSQLFTPHLTPDGNQLVAQALYEYLEERVLPRLDHGAVRRD